MEFTANNFEQYAGEVFVSMGAYRGMAVEEAVDASQGAALNCVELSSGARHHSTDLVNFLSDYMNKNMRFMVHNYFPVPKVPFVLNLAATDQDVLALSIEHCRQAIDLTTQLNAPFYSLHAGFCINASPLDLGKKLKGDRVSRQQGLDVFISTVQQVADYAAAKGVGLLIENNVVSAANTIDGKNEMLLGVTADDLVEIIDRVNKGNVGILLDVAHLKVSANTLGFSAEETIKKIAPWIVACHLSDNDGLTDSNQKVHEKSWFWQPLSECLVQPPVWVLEVYNLEIQAIREQVDLIIKQLQSLNPDLLH